jgi:hypothetical protein
MMKWILILLALILFIGGGYYILTHGGALEMQQEHAVETPSSPQPATNK